jgi:hypothetical protein
LAKMLYYFAILVLFACNMLFLLGSKKNLIAKIL